MKKTLLLLVNLPLLYVAVGCAQNDSRDFVEFKKTQPAESVPKAAEKVTPADSPSKPAFDGVARAGQLPESGATVDPPVVTTAVHQPDSMASTGPSDAIKNESNSDPGAENVAAESPGKTAEPSAAAAVAPGGPRTVTSTQSGLSGPADRPAVDNAVAAEPRVIQLLIPEKRFRRERPSTSLRVSYDDIDLLKVLNMEPVPPNAPEYFPQWLKELDGKTIRIRGFMYPTFVATGLTGFTLARDNGICCFVRQPKIYDIIAVVMAEGETTDYIANRPFDVEGIFRIDPQADDNDLSRLYRIEQARVLN